MVKQILKKIKNKKWLSLCLVLGLTFLVATLSCHPMFKAGSLDKLLNRSFVEQIEAENKYPIVLMKKSYVEMKNVSDVEGLMGEIDKYRNKWTTVHNLPVLEEQFYFSFYRESAVTTFNAKSRGFDVSYMPGLTEHAQILYGEGYDNYTGDGIPCVISEAAMDMYGLVVGEEVRFEGWKDSNGETLVLHVAGVFREKDSQDVFWQYQPNKIRSCIFIAEEAFDSLMKTSSEDFINYTYYQMPDYRAVTNRNADWVKDGVSYIASKEDGFEENVTPLLEQYAQDRKTVEITLWVIEIPILGMVLAYIYMVASQIVETEKNEIAMVKSRGGSRLQVLLMYLLQSLILSVGGLILGLPLGYLLCKVCAGTTDFLTFSFEGVATYQPVWEMLLYGLIAVAGGTVFLLIPVIASSGISIVQRKSAAKVNQKPFWEKFFFDVILLGVAIYLIYNFNQNMPNIQETALQAQKMDPVIFLDSVLFILALGMFFLRLVQYLVKLVYRLGRRVWKPAMYASFLQITRTFGKQSTISVFLILTIALGLFYANMARTINANSVERIIYNTGADMVVSEEWEKKVLVAGKSISDYEYVEPDSLKYTQLLENGMCESFTRVIYDDNAEIKYNNKKLADCMFQAVVTDEFGRTATLDESLYGEEHWYHKLNALAENPQGILISSNLAEEMNLEVGQTVTLTRFYEIETMKTTPRGEMKADICGIVEHWPGYQRYTYEDGVLQEEYLVVMNYVASYSYFKTSPYTVWFNLAEGVEAEDVEEVLAGMELERPEIISVEGQVKEMKESTLIQITNGMFTLSFIIALVLCAVGFMIYWIASIRQRELLFGVYRAMGMTVGNINQMLINEHIFSTLLSVIAGGGVGIIATILFAELFGVIYLPQKHNLDIFLRFDAGDITKITIVVAVMIIVCLVVLGNLIKSMNITQALKLGED